MESRDHKISGKFQLQDITERVLILIRAQVRGDQFDGYVALIDADSNEVSLKRYNKGKIETLAKESTGDLKAGFLDFELESVENRIGFKISGSVGTEAIKVFAKDDEPILGEGRFGISSWGGSVTFDKLSIDHNEKKYPITQINHSASKLIGDDKKIILNKDQQIIERRAMAELCSMLLNLNEFIYVD